MELKTINDSGWVRGIGKRCKAMVGVSAETMTSLDKRHPSMVGWVFENYLQQAREYYGENYEVRCVEQKNNFKTYARKLTEDEKGIGDKKRAEDILLLEDIIRRQDAVLHEKEELINALRRKSAMYEAEIKYLSGPKEEQMTFKDSKTRKKAKR